MPATAPKPRKPPTDKTKPADAIATAIIDLVSFVPESSELLSPNPHERARAIQTAAALRAAAVSGALALPPGPLGLVTILPELIMVWRIQSQMVADIAGAYGKSARLTQEQMLYCLFRHAAAQVVRDLVARVGERVVFRQATLKALQAIALRLGVRVSQRVIAKSVARWLPIVGSVGVAGYAYYDTAQVGATAAGLFQQDIGSEEDDDTSAT